MERILFNCYLNWLKEQNSDLFKRLLKLPIPAKILMVLLIGSLIAIIILALFNIKFVIIPFLIEIIVCLSTSLYTDHYGIKNSIQELNNYKMHCSSFKEMLLSMDLSISEVFCNNLKTRYIEIVTANNRKVENNRITLGKWVKALLVPVVLAVFGLVISPETNYETTLELGITIMCFFVVLFFAVFIVIEIINLYLKSINSKYQPLIDDLQGLIDFRMCSDSIQLDEETVES